MAVRVFPRCIAMTRNWPWHVSLWTHNPPLPPTVADYRRRWDRKGFKGRQKHRHEMLLLLLSLLFLFLYGGLAAESRCETPRLHQKFWFAGWLKGGRNWLVVSDANLFETGYETKFMGVNLIQKSLTGKWYTAPTGRVAPWDTLNPIRASDSSVTSHA